MCIALAAVFRLLAPEHWDPSTLATFGEDSGAIRTYAEQTLGDIVLAPSLGHDGKFFFVQALDPLALDEDRTNLLLDRPIYRLQRVLYPLIAGGFGLLPANAVLWGLIAINVMAMMLGTWATARVAALMGASPWLGLAFPLNPGMLFETFIDGAGVLAWSLAMVGIMYMLGRRSLAGGVALAAAALARESMLLTALGAVLWLRRTNRTVRPPYWVFVPALVWGVLLRFRFPPDPPADQYALSAPFLGFARAFRVWIANPGLDLIMGCFVLLISALLVRRALREPSLLSWSTVGHVLLLPFLALFIWLKYFDLARAAAPAITSVLLLAAPRAADAQTLGNRRMDNPSRST